MILYLVRHGIAEAASELKPDSKRELTKNGIEILKSSCKIWKDEIKRIDFIIASPLIRAVQTANIIKKIFELENETIVDNVLLNGNETEDIISLINSLNVNSILCVGHQPDLSYHLTNLLKTPFKKPNFKPATIAGIEFNDSAKLNSGKLKFLIHP